MVADHCRTYSLSDPNDDDFSGTCDHEHNMHCDRCHLLAKAIDDIQLALANIECSKEEKEELEYIVSTSVDSIRAWKAHLLRNVNQDAARHDILESLDKHSVLLVSDWAMKFIPKKYRESQRDWYGKRGISWHLTVAIRKSDDGKMQMLTLVHPFQSCNQESSAILAIFDDVLKVLKTIKPDVKSVYLKEDNAGCYHSASTMLLIHKVATKNNISLKRIDFSDPQGGKGSCDRKSALLKNHMKMHLNAGHDIETAEQMKIAIESFGGIAGVVVSLCGPQPSVDLKVKWDGVSLINNVEYDTKGIRVWKAYKIGPGKFLEWKSFDLPENMPELNKVANSESTVASFVDIRPRKSSYSQRKTSKTTNERGCDDKDKDAESEGGDGDEEDKVDNEMLYFCPEEGCVRSFRRYHFLENHLACERHEYRIEHETLYDKAMTLYANKLEHGASTIPEMSCEEKILTIETAKVLPKGWALKSTAKKKRFTENQKKYLIEVFQMGEQTGQKANPSNVSKAMRTARNSDGVRLFGKDEFLTSQQISSFFSRVAAKKKIDVCDEDETDNAEFEQHQQDVENELREISNKVMDEVAVQHPIIFGSYDICKLVSQSKLAKFSISMLQDMCTSLELDISSIKVKRKKPYIQLLEKLVAACSCSTSRI